jgi:hypothetical protein
MSEQPNRTLAEQRSAGFEDKLYYLLRSRKFWASLVGIAFILLGPRAGIQEAELTAGVVTIVAYIMGTALEDGLRA